VKLFLIRASLASMKTGMLRIWFLATLIIWVALIGVMPALKKISASTIVFVVLYIDS
jgi:hypothetical protein